MPTAQRGVPLSRLIFNALISFLDFSLLSPGQPEMAVAEVEQAAEGGQKDDEVYQPANKRNQAEEKDGNDAQWNRFPVDGIAGLFVEILGKPAANKDAGENSRRDKNGRVAESGNKTEEWSDDGHKRTENRRRNNYQAYQMLDEAQSNNLQTGKDQNLLL